MQTGLKGQLTQTPFVLERKEKVSAESKMTDQRLKVTQKTLKNLDTKKASRSFNSQSSCIKRSRKGLNPTHFAPATFQSQNHTESNTRVCENSACKAVLSKEEIFCRKCSCSLCHRFDNHKDPSQWIVCESDNCQDDSCGLACHIECAFQQGKAGVCNLGQYMQLDGSYWCSSCGKVSDILRFLKKQLMLAEGAQLVSVLCNRLFCSYRLLNGTLRFREILAILKDAKNKLEAVVGPLNEVSCESGWGIISKLCVASDVQKLCADAITKADEWLLNVSNGAPCFKADSLPAACRFRFEDVTSSSITIVLIKIPISLTEIVKEYKLWYWRTQKDPIPIEPVWSFSAVSRRVEVRDLQPCTEYTFRIVSVTEAGDLGNSEANCFTKSLDTLCEKPCTDRNFPDIMVNSNGPQHADDSPFEFTERDAGKNLHPGNTQLKSGKDVFSIADKGQCSSGPNSVTASRAAEGKQFPPVPRELDLNVAAVPDLNEDISPAFESSGDEENGCALEPAVADKSFAETKAPYKRPARNNEEMFDSGSTLNNASPSRAPVTFDDSYEGWVKTIRSLELQGHVKKDFRLKFLTWLSFSSTEQEKRVVSTYIQALSDEPQSLAAQLLDSFSSIVMVKRPCH